METTTISASVLIESLKQMLAQELLGEKLGWWLRFGAATERWFQFEYGFWLDRCLGNEYAVGFEQRRVDLVVYRAKPIPTTVEEYETLLNLEIKVQGNWFSKKKVFKDIEKDQDKIDKRDRKESVPGASLVFWFLAEPKRDGRHTWISDQVARLEQKNNSVRTLEKIEERMQSDIKGPFDLIQSLPVPNVEHMFDKLDVHVFCYRSETAKQGLLE